MPRRRKTHCKHGHEYTDENTVYDRNGHRSCRECRNAAANRHYYRHRDEVLAKAQEVYREKHPPNPRRPRPPVIITCPECGSNVNLDRVRELERERQDHVTGVE